MCSLASFHMTSWNIQGWPALQCRKGMKGTCNFLEQYEYVNYVVNNAKARCPGYCKMFGAMPWQRRILYAKKYLNITLSF